MEDDFASSDNNNSEAEVPQEILVGVLEEEALVEEVSSLEVSSLEASGLEAGSLGASGLEAGSLGEDDDSEEEKVAKDTIEDFLNFLEMSMEQVPLEQVPDIILEIGEQEPKEVLENTFENSSKEETSATEKTVTIEETIFVNQQNVIPIEREALFEPFEQPEIKMTDRIKKWWCDLFSRP